MSDEKRVFEGVLTRFDEGWIIPEVNIGREDVIEMLEEFDGKAVRLTIEPLPVAPKPEWMIVHQYKTPTPGFESESETLITIEERWLSKPAPGEDDSNGGGA